MLIILLLNSAGWLEQQFWWETHKNWWSGFNTDWLMSQCLHICFYFPASRSLRFESIKKKQAVMFTASFPLAWWKTETERRESNYVDVKDYTHQRHPPPQHTHTHTHTHVHKWQRTKKYTQIHTFTNIMNIKSAYMKIKETLVLHTHTHTHTHLHKLAGRTSSSALFVCRFAARSLFATRSAPRLDGSSVIANWVASFYPFNWFRIFSVWKCAAALFSPVELKPEAFDPWARWTLVLLKVRSRAACE